MTSAEARYRILEEIQEGLGKDWGRGREVREENIMMERREGKRRKGKQIMREERKRDGNGAKHKIRREI